MCKRLIYLTSFVLVLFAAPLVTHAQVDNLVLNPSFEEDEVILDDPDWYQWCTWNDPAGAGSNATIVDTEFIDGTRSLRVEPIGTTDWYFIVANISFPLKVGTQYTISFWAKAEAPRPLATTIKAEDNTITWGWTGYQLTTEWAEYTTTSQAEKDEGKLEFSCAGVEVPFWLDFVYVYEGEYVAGIEPGGAAPQVKAIDPNPADGALLEQTWLTLSWAPGAFAVSHDVYIGENFDDVNDGAESTFLGNQAVTNFIIGFHGFSYPDGLVPGTTYYWRIDEVNDLDPNSPWKGDVWSFWIPPQIAYDPEPADGAKFVDTNVELNWAAGFGARLHYVYFGDNFDDVNSALVGFSQGTTTYTPGPLELEKTYYWRIDEFDGVATNKGDVWSFRTLPVIPISDPSLVGWWKLDEGTGSTVIDWSGHGNHGTINGDPQGTSGYIGDALEFDGVDDYVSRGDIGITGDAPRTIAGWAKMNRTMNIPDWTNVFGFSASSGDDLHFDIEVVGGTSTTTAGYYGIHVHGWEQNIMPPDLEWHHFAASYDGTTIRWYGDGVLVGSEAHPGLSTQGDIRIGKRIDSGGYFPGIVDDVRIYDKVLTVEDILLAMRGDPLVAWGPSPNPGSTPYIRDATPLSWSPGDNASGHDVYFGTDKDAVAHANASDTTGIYRGRQSVTIYTPPDVEWGGGPYYWRVDEYNTDGTISKGNVCSFTVIDFIGIDDFEDYNDYPPDEIFSTWIDGWEVPTNGSMAGHAEPPFAETTIVHGGGQSMPLYYENNFKYSEAAMTLVSVRDWTEEGVGVLSLWFYGDAANTAERMYVALSGSAVVYHDDPSVVQIDTWTEWRIDLQEFAAQGVNLTNVNTISIGFGDKNNIQAGGSGMVFFDDIRLYRPAP